MKKNKEKKEARKFLDDIIADIVGFSAWWLCQVGQTIVDTNADSTTHKTEATINGKRYEVEAIYKVKEL